MGFYTVTFRDPQGSLHETQAHRSYLPTVIESLFAKGFTLISVQIIGG